MKHKSFTRTIHILTQILLALVTVLVAVILLLAQQEAQERQLADLDRYLGIVRMDIDHQIRNADQCLSEIVYDNADLALMGSPSEPERQYAAIRMARYLQDSIHTVDGADSLVVARGDTQLCVEGRRPNISLHQQQFLQAFSMRYASAGVQTGSWDLLAEDGHVYLYRGLLLQHRAVMGFIQADSLLADIPEALSEKCGFFLADPSGTILSTAGPAVGGTVEALEGIGMVMLHTPVVPDILELYICQDSREALTLFQSTALYLLALLLILLCFCIFFTLLIHRELLNPMEAMTRDMAQIRKGQYSLKIETVSDSVEFKTLVDSFNGLLEEILNLKIQHYEKQIALRDAQQRYIRLQLRPHYFLNAMSTIVGLSRAGENQKIEAYISALSKNIRYLFSSGLHTVPLSEEVRQVENYFKMQELKYPGCILYFIDLSEEAKSWPVPQMLIHTIIENEYKYAVHSAQQLMVLMNLHVVQRDGEAMLLIEIEDNGKGYPESVIAAINDEADMPQSQNGSRVGLWSIRRLLELMYDRKGLFQLDNVQPHGAMSRIYIPAHPVHEMQDKTDGEESIMSGGSLDAHSVGR